MCRASVDFTRPGPFFIGDECQGKLLTLTSTRNCPFRWKASIWSVLFIASDRVRPFPPSTAVRLIRFRGALAAAQEWELSR